MKLKLEDVLVSPRITSRYKSVPYVVRTKEPVLTVLEYALGYELELSLHTKRVLKLIGDITNLDDRIIIAGGVFRSIINHTPINDIDVFCISDPKDIKSKLHKYFTDDSSDYNLTSNIMNKIPNATNYLEVLHKDELVVAVKINIIPQEISKYSQPVISTPVIDANGYLDIYQEDFFVGLLSSFDFTSSMIGTYYDKAKNAQILVLEDGALKDIDYKIVELGYRLVQTESHPDYLESSRPINTYQRMIKLLSLGYSIESDESLTVLKSCILYAKDFSKSELDEALIEEWYCDDNGEIVSNDQSNDDDCF